MIDQANLVVWVVDDDASVRWVLEKALQGEGITTRSFDSAQALLDAFDETYPDILMTDVRMPGMDGFELMQTLENGGHVLPIIVMTAHADLDIAVLAYQGGAFEYLPKPFDVDEAVALVHRAATTIDRPRQSAAPEVATIASMIGQAPAMRRASFTRAISAAFSGVLMPKPTMIGRSVAAFIRATSGPTSPATALAAPVMPVIET